MITYKRAVRSASPAASPPAVSESFALVLRPGSRLIKAGTDGARSAAAEPPAVTGRSPVARGTLSLAARGTGGSSLEPGTALISAVPTRLGGVRCGCGVGLKGAVAGPRPAARGAERLAAVWAAQAT